MKTLLVSATVLEIAPTLARLFPQLDILHGAGEPGTIFESDEIDCLVTGVGQMLCAASLAKRLASASYSVAVQAGIAGSFGPELPKRAGAVVAEEHLADLGAEDQSGFLDLFEMGLMTPGSAPFDSGCLRAPELSWPSLEQFPRVRSVTVNRVLSHFNSISWVRDRYQPQVVNMEGAAFLYCCLHARVPCVSLRAVSDFVGPRDKGSWDIPGAVAALNEALGSVLADASRASR